METGLILSKVSGERFRAIMALLFMTLTGGKRVKRLSEKEERLKHRYRSSAYSFCRFSLFLYYSVYTHFNIGHNFLVASDRAFIIHLCIPRGRTFFCIKVKVVCEGHLKNQGDVFQKNGHLVGISVSQTHLLYLKFKAIFMHLVTLLLSFAFAVDYGKAKFLSFGKVLTLFSSLEHIMLKGSF